MGQREEIIAKEELLKKIRQSLLTAKENPLEDLDMTIDVFVREQEMPELVFAKELMKAGGQFIFCENTADLCAQFHALAEQKHWSRYRLSQKGFIDFLQLKNDLVVDADECQGEEISITQCDFLAARTGSILMSTAVCPDRRAWVYCHTHIVIATVAQVVNDLTEAYQLLKEKYNENFPSLVSVVTGPSRTADIEKKLVMGAHGPVELYVFLIDTPEE